MALPLSASLLSPLSAPEFGASSQFFLLLAGSYGKLREVFLLSLESPGQGGEGGQPMTAGISLC